MTAVWRSARSTWLLLSRRALLVRAVLIPMGLALLFTLGPILSAGDNARADLDEFLGPYGPVAVMRFMAFPLGILVLSLAATSVAQEHSLGLLRNTLVRQPRRVPYLLGRVLAIVLLGLAAGALMALVGAISTDVALGSRGLDHSWQLGPTLRLLARVSGIVVTFAVLGACMASLIRSAAATVGITIAWLLVVEQIFVATVWNGGHKVLPGQLMATLVALAGERDHHEISITYASVGLVLWGGAFLVGALFVFNRRDVS